MKHVVVIGAGIVGSTTALALVERGFEVTLLDRNRRVADETSAANGGGVTPCHSEPWNAPGLLGKLVGNLGRADVPYRLSPRAVPGMGRWGWQFLRNMKRIRFVANARANIGLGLYSLECLGHWRERHGLEYRQITRGSMQVYFDQPALREAVALRRELLENRAGVEVLDATEACSREPALAPVGDQLAGALFFPVHESGDARAFAEAVVRRAGELGAQLRLGESVSSIEIAGGRFAAAITDTGRIEADACVIAAGPASAALVRGTRLRLPLYPVRGYSATFELDDPGAAPTLPLLDTARRFVTLRLGARGLRVAGLADFVGHDRHIDPKRMRYLLDCAGTLLPELAGQLKLERAETWAGLRPVTPDGKPLLGPTGIEGLHLNTGHGPMGWTFACGSAEIVSDRLAERRPQLDATAFDPRRRVG